MEDMEVNSKAKFWKNKRVLITGHEGFLGSNLTRTLLNYKAKIIGVDKVSARPISVLGELRKSIIGIKGDISDFKFVNKIINKYNPQVIFHLAAEAIVGEATKNPLNAFKSNIEGTWNILEIARSKKFIKAIVSASSDKAYGSHKALPYKEDTPLKGDHPYDVSKSCADLLCNTYYHTYKVPVCVTRCGNIYGEGDFHFSRIVPDAIRCAVTNNKLLIRSNGKFIRDYIYVKDVVDAYILLAEEILKRCISGEAFNLSNEKPITVLELVKTIYKLCGKKPNYKILNKADCEIKYQYLCAYKSRRVLKWKSRYSLEDGLKMAIKWYKDYFQHGSKK